MASTIETGYAAGTGYGNMQSASVGGKEKTGSNFSHTCAEKFYPSSKDMSLTEYKMYIHDRIKGLYRHPSQKHVDWFIDISDAAYRRMQTDPLYEQKVLEYIAQNKATNFGGGPPRFAFIHIDEDWDKCRTYTLGLQDNCPAKRAAERRRMEAERAKRARRKKLLKEYLKKRAQAKLLQEKFLKSQLTKRRLEHVRLTREWSDQKEEAQFLKEKTLAKKQTAQTQKAQIIARQQEQARALREWNEKRQAVQAFNAYEASLIMLSRYEEQLLT